MRSIKLVTYILHTALMMVSLFSCRHDNYSVMVGDKTIICYMPAENSLAGSIRSDVDEMVKASYMLGEKDRIVVYYDGTSNPEIYVIDKYTNASSLRDLTPVYKYSKNENSCSKDVMKSVFRYICNNYPANTYGLIFNSHGSSWLPPLRSLSSMSRKRAFGVDNGKNTYDNAGDEMHIADLAEAIKTLPHLDFILFDLCYMQSVEVVYELRNCADYIIGSPAEIPGEGAPYDKIMPMLVAKPFNYSYLIYTYDEEYKGWASYSDTGVALSAVRCDKLDSLKIVTKQMMTKYADSIEECKTNGTTNYLRCYYGGYYQTGFYDIKDMMYHMLDKVDYVEWLSVFKMAVPYYCVAQRLYSLSNEGSNYVITNPKTCGALAISLSPDDKETKSIIAEYESLEWGK